MREGKIKLEEPPKGIIKIRKKYGSRKDTNRKAVL
jgi:hypothetical protein